MTVEIKPDLLVGEMLQECRRRNGLLLMYDLAQLLMVTLCYILEGQYHRVALL